MFNKIDIDKWDRKSEYDYFSNGGCNFNMTCNIDITNLYKYVKTNNLKLYFMLVATTIKVLNKHQEFKYSFLDDSFGYYDYMNPVFYNLTMDKNAQRVSVAYNDNILKMVESMESKREQYKSSPLYTPETIPTNSIMISCIPWAKTYGISFDLQYSTYVLNPIVVFTKYEKINNKVIIPLTIYCNHKVNDGYHVTMFFNEYQEYINEL